MNRERFIQGLRDAADFLEKYVDVELPFTIGTSVAPDTIQLTFLPHHKEGMAALARALPGKISKEVSHGYYYLKANYGTFSVHAFETQDAICERVEVGEKIEPEHTIPAVAEQLVPERRVRVYEYRCPSLLAPDAKTREVEA